MFLPAKAGGSIHRRFLLSKAKMVIEVDGGQHFKSEGIEYDKARDEYMASIGLKVLRFTNTEVLGNIDGVIEMIKQNLRNPP